MNAISENWSSLPGADDIHRVELPGAITVLIRENFNSSSVVISGYLPGGSMYDSPDKLGQAYFTALSLMRGTEKRDFHQIYDALESVGATLGFAASVHTLSFAGKALAEDISLLLEVLSQSLMSPVFPAEQVELLRGQIMAGIQMRDQNTSEVASMAFDELVFANHPYGRPEEGYLHTVEGISRQNLIDFHKDFYGPQGMVIAVVGAVKHEKVVEEITSHFNGWKAKKRIEPPLPALKALEHNVRRHIPLQGKYQADVVLGTLAPGRTSDDYLTLIVGNNILGQFGLMGRIGDSVREKAGLAYYAASSYSASLAGGSFEVNAGVNIENVQKAIDLIRKELDIFINQPVTPEELADSQSNIIGRLPLSLESNAGVAGALINLERYQLGLDYYREYPGMVRAITRDNILEAFRRFLDPQKLCVVSSGPELAE